MSGLKKSMVRTSYPATEAIIMSLSKAALADLVLTSAPTRARRDLSP